MRIDNFNGGDSGGCWTPLRGADYSATEPVPVRHWTDWLKPPIDGYVSFSVIHFPPETGVKKGDRVRIENSSISGFRVLVNDVERADLANELAVSDMFVEDLEYGH